MSLTINFIDSSGDYLVVYFTDTTSATYFNIAVDGATPDILSYTNVYPVDITSSGVNGMYKTIQLGPL